MIRLLPPFSASAGAVPPIFADSNGFF